MKRKIVFGSGINLEEKCLYMVVELSMLYISGRKSGQIRHFYIPRSCWKSKL